MTQCRKWGNLVTLPPPFEFRESATAAEKNVPNFWIRVDDGEETSVLRFFPRSPKCRTQKCRNLNCRLQNVDIPKFPTTYV
jgi:hypothetical protein